MFRLWAKEFKDNRMLRDTVIEVDNDDTRTHKIFHAIDEVCHEFDLSNPIWLDSNIDEFKRHAKTRFHQDNFVDSIEFDYLEIHIIEKSTSLGQVIFSPVPFSPVLAYFIHCGLPQADSVSLPEAPGNIPPPFRPTSQIQEK